MKELSPRYQQYLDRMATAVDSRLGMSGALSWAKRNTYIKDKKFSLKHHEAQEAWFMGGDQMEPHPRVTIIKPSQIGATEATIRMTVAFAACMRGTNILYVMPTGKMAEKNSTVRIKPIIESSPALNYGRNSTQSTWLRQVGTSFVHIGGTQDSTGGAISTPAEAVILDEYDFMNMKIAGQYESRIRHATEFDIPGTEQTERGILYRFSTPTLPGYGVDGLMQSSNAMRYMVKCGRCGTRQAPNFMEDVVIPGFDFPMSEFRGDHVGDDRYDIQGAYLKCQHCGKKLHEELLDVDTREWVAQRPDVLDHRGFETKPFDFYHYNKIPGLLTQAKGGFSHGDWVNFALGEAYEDGNQAFSLKPLDDGTAYQSEWIPPNEANRLQGCSIGCDVGNTSDLVVGRVKLDSDGVPEQITIHYWERFNTKNMTVNGGSFEPEFSEKYPVPELFDRVSHLQRAYHARGVVIDQLPDQTAALKVSNASWGMQAQYISGGGRTADLIMTDKDEHVARVFRTKMFNHLLYLWSNGRIVLPKGMPESMKKDLRKNMANVKKVVTRLDDTNGEPEERWIKVETGAPDHFMHAMLYMVTAAIWSGGSDSFVMPPRVSTFTQKSGRRDDMDIFGRNDGARIPL